MKRRFAKAVWTIGLALLVPQEAAAQQTAATYFAALGPQDHVNSSGAPLGSFAAILQQDRANYHRFGRRDAHDEGDPFFGDAEVRAMIPALFAAGDNGWWAAQPIRPPTGQPLDADIIVFVCATQGRLSHIIVNHANGDGYNTCEGPVFAGQ